MAPINSMPEAKAELIRLTQSVQALAEFFERFEGALSQLEALRGVVPAPATEPKPQTSTGAMTKAVAEMAKGYRIDLSAPIPATVLERVFTIVKEANKPLMPAEIVAEYERRRWPLPEANATLYDAVGSSLAYQTNRKFTLKRTEGGYVVNREPEAVRHAKAAFADNGKAT